MAAALRLLANPFHLVVETPNGNLVAGMKGFLGTGPTYFYVANPPNCISWPIITHFAGR